MPNDRILIDIGKGTLRAFRVDVGSPQLKNPVTLKWKDESLADVLAKVKEKFGQHKVRLGLGDELSYVASVKLPAGGTTRASGAIFRSRAEHYADTKSSVTSKTTERLLVLDKAQELIPEELTSTPWDYKLLTLRPPFKTEGKLAQVVAVAPTFHTQLVEALGKAKLEVEACEPLAVSASRLTATDADPHLILVDAEAPFAVLAAGGVALSAWALPVTQTLRRLEEGLAGVTAELGVTIKNVYVLGDVVGIDEKALEKKGWKVETKKLDPLIGLAQKKDLRGKDANVLNLEIAALKPAAKPGSFGRFLNIFGSKSAPKTPESRPDEAPGPTGSELQDSLNRVSAMVRVNVRLLVAFVVVLIFGIVVNGAILISRAWSTPDESRQVSAPPAAPLPPPAPPQASSTVQVINATGIEGAGLEVSRMLESVGFPTAAPGLSPRVLTRTSIQAKLGVPTEELQLLVAELKKLYTIDQNIVRRNTLDSDIIVTLGGKPVESVNE